MLIFQGIGTEMASMLANSQQSLNNECNDNEPILQPHPDQTDTIDGKFFLNMKRQPFYRCMLLLHLVVVHCLSIIYVRTTCAHGTKKNVPLTINMYHCDCFLAKIIPPPSI